MALTTLLLTCPFPWLRIAPTTSCTALVSTSLAQTLVAGIFFICAGLPDLPTDATPYSGGIKLAVIVMFCVIPMIAWVATLWAMKGYKLTGARMKEIQTVNAARKAYIAEGHTLEEAMQTYKSVEDVQA